MTLLFDQNISFRIVRLLRREFPGYRHVSDAGLMGSPDNRMRAYSKIQKLAIVTFDQDHVDLAVIDKQPPKVILLTTGNTSTLAISHLIAGRAEQINDLLVSEVAQDLVLELP